MLSRMNKHLVFVYGTLRRGGLRAMPEVFPGAKLVGRATVRGRLYDLGEYPGLLLLDGASGARVAGEVYAVGEETLGELDAVEAADDYRRRRVEATLDAGASPCWVYVGGRDAQFYSRHPLIASGDWIAHAAARADRPDGAETDRPDETER